MSKHTPGPWSLDRLNFQWTISVPDARQTNPLVETGKTVANVMGNNSTAEANARLIAAAPELLEVAKIAIGLAVAFKKDLDAGVAFAEDKEIGRKAIDIFLIQITDAIAKAEGEEK